MAPPSAATPAEAATKRQEQRLKSKKNLEFAHVYVIGMIEECTRREQEKREIERELERAIRHIVLSTTTELLGDNEDPEETLERYIIENGLDRKEGKRPSY